MSPRSSPEGTAARVRILLLVLANQITARRSAREIGGNRAYSERRIKQEDVISNCFISRKNDGKSSTDGNEHRQYFSCAPGGSHPSRIAQKLIFHKDLNRHLFLINLLVYFQRNSMNLNSNRRFLSGTNS